MSAYWRNLVQKSPTGASIFGDPRVGLPSEDIDPSGLMGDDAVTYSGQLLRMFSSNIPNGTFINEDGSYTGEPPSYWELYVDGALVGERLNRQPLPRRGHLAENMHRVSSNRRAAIQKRLASINAEEKRLQDKLNADIRAQEALNAQTAQRLAELERLEQNLKLEYDQKYNTKIFSNSLIPWGK